MSTLNIISRSTRYLLFLLLSIGFPSQLIAQESEAIENQPSQTEAAPAEDTTSQSNSIFSIKGGEQLMMEADEAIDSQQYDVAVQKLQSARQVYNQLSNFYLQLFNSFTGLDNRAAESHRQKALDTSLERDEATYQLALVHRSQNQPELSIPLLVQIITSQSPGVGLGRKAYEQLLEIGFVDTPFTPPKPEEVQSPPPQAPANGQPPVEGQPQPQGQPQGQPAIPQIPSDIPAP